VKTCPQNSARFRGAKMVSRRFADGLTLTIAATIAFSLGASAALAQMTGTGKIPVTVKPTSLTFYGQLVGTRSAGKTVIFTNDGSADVYFTKIALEGVNADQFTVTTTCGIGGAALAPGDSCTTTVYYAPSIAGAQSVILVYDGNFTQQAVWISATGTAVVIKPKALTFPKTTVGTTSAPETITFRNVGPTALAINSVSWTGTEPPPFSETNTCNYPGGSVPANSSCTFSITFSPLAAGTFTATMWIGDADPSGPQEITVTGTGVQ
jgi:hypothetical protein